ncbi:PREDICTED: MICOS complex subunit Mic19-like, partial [Nestor notabilis]|uniref:MICOS complex subunit Mic19-like n=1 Tax=Nestor notabilis TaxID=176057 RepID=UPI000523D674
MWQHENEHGDMLSPPVLHEVSEGFIRFYFILGGKEEGNGVKEQMQPDSVGGYVFQLSDSVIDRMKEPSSPSGRPQSQSRSSGAVIDEQLKKRIAEELALERARRDSEAQKRRLKQEQMYVRDEFGRLLEQERISSNEHLTRAILRERAATEEERQKAQRF